MHAESWSAKAPALARWAYKHLFVRFDTHVKYTLTDGQKRDFTAITGSKLLTHFKGDGERVGSYSTSLTDMAKWCVWDADDHKGEGLDAKNFETACEIVKRLRELGIIAILENSSPGSYKVWAVFMEEVPSADLHALAKWVVRDMPKMETNPKQASIAKMLVGSCVRLPGRHYKHLDWWSRFWNGTEWLEGEKAVEYLLSYDLVNNDPRKIPDEARTWVPPKAKPPEGTFTGGQWREGPGREWLSRFKKDLRTVDMYGLLEEAKRFVDDGHPIQMYCPFGEFHSGDEFCGVYVNKDRIPHFHCLHDGNSKCSSRPQSDFWEALTVELVEKHCTADYVPLNLDAAAEFYEKEILTPKPTPKVEQPTAEKPKETPEAAPQPDPEKPQPQPDAEQPQPDAEQPFQIQAKFYKRSELRLLPPSEWLVENIIMENSFNTLFGESDTYKTFLGFELGASIASGRPFFGIHEVKQGKVLYVCSESGRNATKRMDAWEKHNRVSFPEDNFLVAIVTFNLDTEEGLAKLIKSLEPHLKDGISLVVIDTTTKNMAGDDSDGQDTKKLLKAGDIIRAKTKAALLFTTHSGHSTGHREKGSVNLKNAADTRIGTERVGPDLVKVECMKQKEEEKFQPFLFETKKIILGQNAKGKPVSSLVLIHKGEAASAKEVAEKKDEAGCLSIINCLRAGPKNQSEIEEATGLSEKMVQKLTPILGKKAITEKVKKKFVLTSTWEIAWANFHK